MRRSPRSRRTPPRSRLGPRRAHANPDRLSRHPSGSSLVLRVHLLSHPAGHGSVRAVPAGPPRGARRADDPSASVPQPPAVLVPRLGERYLAPDWCRSRTVSSARPSRVVRRLSGRYARRCLRLNPSRPSEPPSMSGGAADLDLRPAVGTEAGADDQPRSPATTRTMPSPPIVVIRIWSPRLWVSSLKGRPMRSSVVDEGTGFDRVHTKAAGGSAWRRARHGWPGRRHGRPVSAEHLGHLRSLAQSGRPRGAGPLGVGMDGDEGG